MELVGRPLPEALSELQKSGKRFIVGYTHPTRDVFKVDQDQIYIIRERTDEDGVVHLTAAAKLRKEV